MWHESMATRQGNVHTTQAPADSISPDSLSFSGLVSIREEQSKYPSPNEAKYNQVSKQDPEFEFVSTKPNLNSEVNPIKITPADLLISNGQLQPQALAFQTSQSLIRNPSSSLSSLLATDSSSNMSSGKTGSTMRYHERLDKSSRDTNKENTVTRTRFGQKMKCFLSPCRECRAIKPDAAKAQRVPRENFKIY